MFIKKVFENKVDEDAHRKFVRFGKGIFNGRAPVSLALGEKIKLRGGYELANDFISFLSSLGNFSFSGIVLSKEDFLGGKKKKELYQYEGPIESSKIREIKDRVYFFLLDSENSEFTLKMKKKLPKPGKSGEAKLDDKFCQLEISSKYWNQIKGEFFWDVQVVKKAKAQHTFIITDIIYPQGEKDFEKIRLLAKRKGKLIRKLEVDGKELVKETEFEA